MEEIKEFGELTYASIDQDMLNEGFNATQEGYRTVFFNISYEAFDVIKDYSEAILVQGDRIKMLNGISARREEVLTGKEYVVEKIK